MAAAEAAASPRRTVAPGGARGRRSWPLVVAIGLFCFSAILPLLFMAATAFRTQADWANSKIGLPTTLSLGAFERAWTGANIGIYFRNSVIVTTATVVLSVISATLAGYAFAKLRWRLSGGGLPVRPRLDRVPAAPADGADLRRDGPARAARHVRVGDLPLHGAQPAVQRLPDDRLLPVGARRADRGGANRRRRHPPHVPAHPAAARQAGASRRWSSSTSSGRGTSSCSRC